VNKMKTIAAVAEKTIHRDASLTDIILSNRETHPV